MAEKLTQSDEQKQAKAAKLLPINSYLQEYREQLGDGSLKFRGLESGFEEIDNLISGLDRFILLAGRSGAGKTTLAIQLALGVAERKIPVLVYSLEMSRSEILTKFLQAACHSGNYMGVSSGLYANTVELNGNSPHLDPTTKTAIEDSLNHLTKLGERLYIRDSGNGVPPILDTESTKKADSKTEARSIYRDIEDAKASHGVDKVLVIIDSVQDIVPASNNQVQAEVKALGDLTTLQQKTNATILVTAQKNKASTTSVDSYGDVMGSMSFIHKPNTVLTLETPREMLRGMGGGKNGGLTAEQQKTLKELEENAKHGQHKPMALQVLKGRFTGTGMLPLSYYGAWGYFTAEEDLNFKDFYDKLEGN